jgi:glycerate 2-kinase
VSDTFVIAPDKFKGSLTAGQAAEAIARGVEKARPDAECRLCPMADGGEGTVDVFLARGARAKRVTVCGPLGDPVEATIALRGDTAILEMSSASGMRLLEPRRYDPVRADTFGTGQLIATALDGGAKRLIVGLGGSATNDAGTGMLRALGVRFRAGGGSEIAGPMPAYRQLASIDLSGLDPRLAGVRILAATDVDNPLCGPNGAARTFAAQKGANAEEIEQLDALLSHIADVAAATLHRDERDTPGAGAAGGLGFALIAFLGATAESGVALVAREWDLKTLLRDAAVCMTGEGKIDAQTLHGKTVSGVADAARACGVPVIAFAGVAERDAGDALRRRGVQVDVIAPDGMPREQAMQAADALLEAAAEAATRKLAAR